MSFGIKSGSFSLGCWTRMFFKLPSGKLSKEKGPRLCKTEFHHLIHLHITSILWSSSMIVNDRRHAACLSRFHKWIPEHRSFPAFPMIFLASKRGRSQRCIAFGRLRKASMPMARRAFKARLLGQASSHRFHGENGKTSRTNVGKMALPPLGTPPKNFRT